MSNLFLLMKSLTNYLSMGSNKTLIDPAKTFYYHNIPMKYDSEHIISSYKVSNGMSEKEYKKRYPHIYWGKVIEYFEDDMCSLCGLSRSDYKIVQGVDLSKDGIYIEDFDNLLYTVVIDGKVVIRYEDL